MEVPPLSLFENEVKDMMVTFVVEGYHLYQDMMSVAPNTTEGSCFHHESLLGKMKQDPANPDQMREVFDTAVQVKVPVTSDTPGVYTTELTVQYQGCKRDVVLHAQNQIRFR